MGKFEDRLAREAAEDATTMIPNAARRTVTIGHNQAMQQEIEYNEYTIIIWDRVQCASGVWSDWSEETKIGRGVFEWMRIVIPDEREE